MEVKEIFRVLFFLAGGISFLGITGFFIYLSEETTKIISKVVCVLCITSSVLLSAFMFSVIFINPENNYKPEEAVYEYNLGNNKYINISEEQHNQIQMYAQDEESEIIYFSNDKTSTKIKSDSYKKVQPKSNNE